MQNGNPIYIGEVLHTLRKIVPIYIGEILRTLRKIVPIYIMEQSCMGCAKVGGILWEI